jgi:hypothetical protein
MYILLKGAFNVEIGIMDTRKKGENEAIQKAIEKRA